VNFGGFLVGGVMGLKVNYGNKIFLFSEIKLSKNRGDYRKKPDSGLPSSLPPYNVTALWGMIPFQRQGTRRLAVSVHVEILCCI
jgi:hypothetical protein